MEMLPCQLGNVHGDINRQGMPHPYVVQHFFKRCLLVVEIGKIFFLDAV